MSSKKSRLKRNAEYQELRVAARRRRAGSVSPIAQSHASRFTLPYAKKRAVGAAREKETIADVMPAHRHHPQAAANNGMPMLVIPEIPMVSYPGQETTEVPEAAVQEEQGLPDANAETGEVADADAIDNAEEASNEISEETPEVTPKDEDNSSVETQSVAEAAADTAAEQHHENKTDNKDSEALETENREAKDSKKQEQSKKDKQPNALVRNYRKYKESTFYSVWSKRPKYSYGAYLVVAFVLTEILNMFQLWSVNSKAEYKPKADKSFFVQVIESEYHSLASNQAILNFFGMGVVLLVLVTVINRFWVALALYGSIFFIFAIANKIKSTLRSEPVIPSDLSFVSSGASDSVASFVPANLQPIVDAAVPLLIWFVAICVILQFLDRRNAFIHCSWIHPFKNAKNIIGNILRIMAAVLSVCLLLTYTEGLSNPHSGTRSFLTQFKYDPKMWNVMYDATDNGSVTTFLSLSNVKAMDKMPSYNEKKMEEINAKYQKAADRINAERSANLTDNTVIMVLSESFSDPQRVPGISLGEEPIPFINSLKDSTTSGLALSPGYGGGTANIEFQQNTGLSTALLNQTMLSPYQQLVPGRSEMFSFNQMWNAACKKKCSVGIHPYFKALYLRDSNYKKFQFSNFLAWDSKPALKHTSGIDRAPYTSDQQAYENVLDYLNENQDHSQYIELITMQNHLPYNDVYDNNQFHGLDYSTGISDSEHASLQNYAKGIQLTDQATQEFLGRLNAIDRPITVVFYGDHLPSFYSTASKDANNNLVLHETDYFIWSNNATQGARKLAPETSAYTSSNYFMSETANHLNAKVSPYLALLTEVHKEIPALARIGGGAWTADGDVTMLDAEGKPISPSSLSKKAKDLLHDYKLVQYDMAVGKNYLLDMGFTSLPTQ